MFDVHIDFSGLKQCTDLAKRIPDAADAGLGAAGKVQEEAVGAEIDRIATRPIPKRPRSKKDMWKRSGRLKKGLKLRRTPVRGIRVVEITGKARRYAARRHQLGAVQGEGAWMPKRPALNVVRRNEFFREGKRKANLKVVPAFIEGFTKKLGV